MAKKKGKKGHKALKFGGSVEPFTFRVKTIGTAVVDIDTVWPDDELQEDDDPGNLNPILEVTLARVKPVTGAATKKWHVIGNDSTGTRKGWWAPSGRRFKIFVKDSILLVKDGNGDELPTSAAPTLGSGVTKDTFTICEDPTATTCRYVVQGGVARKICS